MRYSIEVGARGSALSCKQVQEVLAELQVFYPEVEFCCTYVKTVGDRDQSTSLRLMDRTDFFTREIEELQLSGSFRISIHSAKDLPAKLRDGLEIAAITKGVSNADALVYRHWPLPLNARIGTSSLRRESMIQSWRSDLQCVDIRGTIDQRLFLLHSGEIDGLILAEAAIFRLGWHHLPRISLSGETASMQGRLAIVVRSGDDEMKKLFFSIHWA